MEAIIMGDSRALAMNPLGLSWIYNYSMSYWGGMYPYRHILRKYLKNNSAPRIILFSIIPETFFTEKDYMLSNRTEALFPPGILEILKGLFTQPKAIKEKLFARFVVVLPFEPRLDKTLLNKETGSMLFRRKGVHIFNPASHYLEFPKGVPLTPEDVELKFHGIPFEPTPVALHHWDKFMQITKENEIHVVFYFMPIPRPVFKKYSYFFDIMSEFVKSLESQFSNITVISPYSKKDLFPMAYFGDGSHFNQKGSDYFHQHRFPEIIDFLEKLNSSLKNETSS